MLHHLPTAKPLSPSGIIVNHSGDTETGSGWFGSLLSKPCIYILNQTQAPSFWLGPSWCFCTLQPLFTSKNTCWLELFISLETLGLHHCSQYPIWWSRLMSLPTRAGQWNEEEVLANLWQRCWELGSPVATFIGNPWQIHHSSHILGQWGRGATPCPLYSCLSICEKVAKTVKGSGSG